MKEFLKTQRYFILSGFIIWMSTAWFSTGYYQADEHYQVLEFALYKQQVIQQSDLAWEYQAQLRPGLQPWIAANFLKATKTIGISDPFLQTALLRMITSLLFFVLFIFLTVKLLWEYPTRKYTWLLPALGLFLWFIPFVACRFSSETWSALFFFAGVLPFVGRKNKPKPLTLIVSGFALGLSFHFRYQAIILIAGLFLWLLLMNKAQLKNILLLMAGLIPALFAGVLADKWLYNEWAFPFINYLDYNIFSGQANATFGTSPWWYYFGRFAEKSAIVPGTIVFLSLFYFLFKNPRHLFNWLWLPFLLAHMFTGHKELRFLIPVFPVIPFVLFYMFQETRQYFTLKRFVLNPLMVLALVLNVFMLIILTYSPAEFSVKALEEIQKNSAKSDTVYYSGENPASPFGLPNNFYTNKTMTFEKADSLPAKESGSKYIYITYKGALPKEFASTKPVLQSIPSILRFFNFNGWLDRTTRSELRILD